MTHLRAIQVAAWASLALVAFATLASIGFRPTSSLPPTVERFAAFAAVGFTFALAYPRQFWLAAFIVIGAALALEVLQVLSPSRHGRLVDSLVKIVGGSAGLFAGWVLLWLESLRERIGGCRRKEVA
ncbi:VanZ family protein [Bradyrhizobium sp. LHD-71]|uniref:VanZ family protein n=1 Tax=Bradyrhizobium sp. LHD-71 TaxID=3072141 RepID=UPI00280DB122|nr:VanZ family protein [Bradyrhizobium sp. LHD-71]MDQ8726664.1 VanZ family protein [Bradyrhizobium sp. LHD-71]